MLKGQFENDLKWPGADDSDWVLTHADYLASGGEPLHDLLVSTLTRAGASL